jgi:hypothetical protein
VTTIKSAEPLAGTTVKIQGTTKATSSDNNGIFSFKLIPGSYVLTFSNIGFKNTKRNIRLYGDGAIEIQMQPEVTELQEVVIKSDKESHTGSLQIGATKLTIESIKMVPRLSVKLMCLSRF